ncbi:hypothetical protein C5167_003752 [Papaver somniferum]|uniref:Uncharacterized protein n=1 Tax=Papaver somniferum TaxID=3469 RepID=A0A4Y7KQZ8_PAPSO|nr:hypothetical protein C5167_050758 [Papaver somniferum]RZC79553.1 hypothetical protein C5167_003752 [Papaver somniferum]
MGSCFQVFSSIDLSTVVTSGVLSLAAVSMQFLASSSFGGRIDVKAGGVFFESGCCVVALLVFLPRDG